MKKIAFMLAMSAAVLVSCQKNEMALPVSENEVFTASVESFDTQTKTSMTQDRQVVWSQGDRLAIFQGSTLADEYKVTDASAGKSNATFDIVSDNSDVNGSFSAGVEVSRNIALYPYMEDLSLTASALDDEGGAYKIAGFILPSTQNYAAGSFGNGTFPMVAVTETMSDHNLKFKNVLGAMKLRFKGTRKVMTIKVEGNDNEILSGAAVITAYADNLTPAITMTATNEASKSVTLDCGDGVQLSESAATEFIIALPSVLFSQGFKVTVTDSENKEKVIQTDVANTVLRSSILSMPTVILGDEVTEDGEGDTDSSIKVLDIAFDKSSLTLAPSTSYSLITIVVPETADDKTLTWSSDAPAVATVDQSGVVTAVSDGTATITAVAVGGASKSCTVNVISVPTSVATADYVDEYGINHGKGIAIGGTVWAPVNCGYKAATVEDGVTTDKGYPYGKLYQWGRKYGQGYSADYDSEPLTYPAPVSAIVGQNKSMQEYFFVGQSNWIETPDDKLWNIGTEESPVKTDNDPCPDGWRVPTYSELYALRTDHSDWTSKDNQEGYYFSGVAPIYDTSPLGEDKPQVFFPATGFRDYGGGAGGRGGGGQYWSSKSSNDFAYYLFLDGNATMFYYYRACGYSVRCVQVTDEVAEL